MTNNYEIDEQKRKADEESDGGILNDIKEFFEDDESEDFEEDAKTKTEPKKKLIGEEYLTGLPMNVIRYLFIPCVLAFLIYRNSSAIYASGFGISSLLYVIPLVFFSCIAVYLSFVFLKAQIASRASTPDERVRISGITLKAVLLRGGSIGSPYFLKRQGLIFEFFAGLFVPTSVFILVFLVMNMLNIFAFKVVYVVVAFVLLLALMNYPVSIMRSKAADEIQRLG
ncbi:hypothetical protein ALQ37_200158 [Pseudomonas syringae pv. aptata]|uniref:Uncharacterized protein n=1 Tax=Pseudomonas syringae pv. aptata TaxID=83167 RepID=A0A0Q0C550_PSEAP|nr:hypothetical protein [Pseudomonas syringae]KPY97971.1 Unknown protein sequence [Pseudomonas syringae pv. aptata]RMO65454.1 hypothetical protein ALQ37_200158 [Pseudomonas syringae pv. aptata]